MIETLKSVRNIRWRWPLFFMLNVVFFGFLFYRDYTAGVDITGREVVGTLVMKTNSVQRKLPDQMSWTILKQGSPIVDKETILTNTDSSALIKLKTETEIDLDESSMIRMEISGGMPSIDFQKGAIGIQGTSTDHGLVLKTGDKTIELGDSEVNLSQGNNGELAIFVHKGSVTINTGSGPITIKPNQKAVIGKDGNIDVRTIDIRLKKPQNSKIISSRKDRADVTFAIETDGDDHPQNPHTLTVAKDRKFERVVIEKKSSKTTFKEEVPPGTYWWHVSKQKDGVQKTSEPRKLTVVKEEKIKTITPVAGLISLKKQMERVIFQWSSDQYANNFILEVSRTRDFSRPVVYRTTLGNTVSVDSMDLPDGTYHWRVRSISHVDGIPDRVSDIVSFRVKRLYPPATPEIIMSEAYSQQELDSTSIREKGAYFSWTPVDGASSYQLQVSRDIEFRDILAEKRTTGNQIRVPIDVGLPPPSKIKEKKPQTDVFWRVRSFDQQNRPSAYSQPTRMAIRYSIDDLEKAKQLLRDESQENLPDAPKIYLGDAYTQQSFDSATIREKGAYLAWEPVEDASSYQLQVARDPGFREMLVEKRTTSSKIHVPIDVGGTSESEGGEHQKKTDVYWRVRSFDKENHPSAYSQPTRMAIRHSMEKKEEFEQPVNNEDRENLPDAPKIYLGDAYTQQSFDSATIREKGAYLAWEPVKDASSYQIQVSRDEKFNDIMVDKRTTSNRVQVPIDVGSAPDTGNGSQNPKADVYWRVRSYDRDYAPSAYSQPVRMSIRYSTEEDRTSVEKSPPAKIETVETEPKRDASPSGDTANKKPDSTKNKTTDSEKRPSFKPLYSYTMTEYNLYLKDLAYTCGDLSIPDMLIDECFNGFQLLKLNTRSDYDLYHYLKLNSSNQKHRLQGYSYFNDSCNPVFIPAFELIGLRIHNPHEVYGYLESKRMMISYEHMKACKQ